MSFSKDVKLEILNNLSENACCKQAFFVEHTNIFVGFQRLDVRVQEIASPLFVPDQIVTPYIHSGKNQLCREQAVSKQHDCAVFLDHTPILEPQGIKRNDFIPFVPGGSVWQITQNQVNR